MIRIVIDEAHLIEVWGDDFRKAYKDLEFLKLAFSDVPISCFTARVFCLILGYNAVEEVVTLQRQAN